MLIKQADDHAEELAQLEQLAEAGKGEAAKFATHDLRIRKAGIKGEAESAYLINFYYAASPNWAVIHDLRVEQNGRTAQIDHLLINRSMECYVLESKHFHAGIKITEDGEFMRWNDYKHTFEGMPSPLLQNERHIAVLRDVMATLDLPARMGLRITFSFQTFVLVASSARIDRPKKFDSSRVIKADQIEQRIGRDFDKENALRTLLKTAAKVVSSDTLRDVAQQLADQHCPTKWHVPSAAAITPSSIAKPMRSAAHKIAEPAMESPGDDASATASPPAVKALINDAPRCKVCQGEKGTILHGKYGYYFQCASCHTNTAIKFTCLPGHQPRLRKAGSQFFRECAECGSSELYFTNS
jgi:hypothetical protein